MNEMRKPEERCGGEGGDNGRKIPFEMLSLKCLMRNPTGDVQQVARDSGSRLRKARVRSIKLRGMSTQRWDLKP